MRLNGWRRLALVLCGAWCIGSFAILSNEFLKRQDGFFVAISLPVGTIFSDNSAILPDGRKINTNIAIDGRVVKPWEVKWDNEPEVPTVLSIRWTKLVLQGVLFPFGLWAVMELLNKIGGWIARGFRDQNPRDLKK